ncbi:MAG: hypothetical protein JWO07_126 [Candidatus Saccharibacteria bacterium]|nr:hypothetical protein [Candidatus Saccharibacteria bacterium]
MDKPLATHDIGFDSGKDKQGCEIMTAALAVAKVNNVAHNHSLDLLYLKTYHNQDGFILCQAALRGGEINNNDARTLYILPDRHDPTRGFCPEDVYEGFSVMSGIQVGFDGNGVGRPPTDRLIENVRYVAEEMGKKLGVGYILPWRMFHRRCAYCMSPLEVQGSANLLACPEHGVDAPVYTTRIPDL